MTNEIIRKKAKKEKVAMWRIAERLNINESVLSRRMRHELSEEDTKQILKVIDEIAAGRQSDDE